MSSVSSTSGPGVVIMARSCPLIVDDVMVSTSDKALYNGSAAMGRGITPDNSAAGLTSIP